MEKIVIIILIVCMTTLFSLLMYTINLLQNEKIVEEIPKGSIIAFYPKDKSYLIPIGWFVCDGTNNTPDLRNRFIIGAYKNVIGSFIGESEHILTNDQLPQHSHLYNKTQNAISGLPNETFLPVNVATFRSLRFSDYNNIFNKDTTYYTGGTSGKDGLIVNQDPNYVSINGISNLFPPDHKALNQKTTNTLAGVIETPNNPISLIPPSIYLLYIMKAF